MTMSHRFLPVVLCAVLLSASASAATAPAPEPAMTVEEQVIANSFITFVTAEKYDQVCNKTRVIDRKAMNEATVNYVGNEQMLAARIGGLMKSHNADLSPEIGAKALAANRDKIATQYAKILKEKGCEASEAKAAAKILKIYTETPPAVISSSIGQMVAMKTGKNSETPKGK